MKAPSKTKRIKKYMILFSLVLFSVVLSIGLAFYVGTKDVVEDIPKKVGVEFQKQPPNRNIQLTLQSMNKTLNNIPGGHDEIEKDKNYVSLHDSWLDCSQDYCM